MVFMRQVVRSVIHVLPLLVVSSVVQSAEPQMVYGVYEHGHNITEPRPQKSRFLQTTQGGVVVLGQKAGFFLTVKTNEHPKSALYIRVEYEDPRGGIPAWNDMEFSPNAGGFNFSSPGFVEGLKIYSDYEIKVSIFERSGDPKPIDVLRQKVRSYVDTRGTELKVFSKLQPDAP
jgi:hypothetical protein